MNQSAPGPFQEGKLLDFFLHFDPERPQHREGVRRLERSLRAKAPELLNDLAYWVQGWRSAASTPPPGDVDNASRVVPQYQSTPRSCGAASVAMCISALGAQKVDDQWVLHHYGYSLLPALQSNCPGWEWRDAGNFTPAMWPAIRDCLTSGGLAIIGLNGPEFSPSGYGHIMVICGLSATEVILADPARGAFRTVSRQLVEQCPPHTDGKFVFLSTPRGK